MKIHVVLLILFFFLINPLTVGSQNHPDSIDLWIIEKLSMPEMAGVTGEWDIRQGILNKEVIKTFKEHIQDTGEKGNRRAEPIKANIPESLGVDRDGILGSGSDHTIPPLRLKGPSSHGFMASTPESPSSRFNVPPPLGPNASTPESHSTGR